MKATLRMKPGDQEANHAQKEMMKFIHPNHESNRMVSMSGKGG
jgi:hypothetical protein